MGTVIALESDAGIAIAGDSRVSTDGIVRDGQIQTVIDVRGVALGLSGDPGAVQQFERKFEAVVRDAGFKHESIPEIESVSRIAARIASETNTDAVVVAPDKDGNPSLRQVSATGGVLESTAVAIGTGAPTAIGRLETVSSAEQIEDLAEVVREIMERVKEQDPETGGTVTVRTLANTENS